MDDDWGYPHDYGNLYLGGDMDMGYMFPVPGSVAPRPINMVLRRFNRVLECFNMVLRCFNMALRCFFVVLRYGMAKCSSTFPANVFFFFF